MVWLYLYWRPHVLWSGSVHRATLYVQATSCLPCPIRIALGKASQVPRLSFFKPNLLCILNRPFDKLSSIVWSGYTICFLCVCVYCCLSHVWLCNPMDCSPPGSSVHGILQARILSGLLCPPPGDLPDPRIEPVSPALASRFFTTRITWEALLKPYFTLGYTPIISLLFSVDGYLGKVCLKISAFLNLLDRGLEVHNQATWSKSTRACKMLSVSQTSVWFLWRESIYL